MAKNIIGGWAFLIGVVLAIIVGVLAELEIVSLTNTILASVLLALGAIIGLLNITRQETTSFMIAGVVLIISVAFGAGIAVAVPGVLSILEALLFIVVPATIIVAIKSIFSLAKK